MFGITTPEAIAVIAALFALMFAGAYGLGAMNERKYIIADLPAGTATTPKPDPTPEKFRELKTYTGTIDLHQFGELHLPETTVAAEPEFTALTTASIPILTLTSSDPAQIERDRLRDEVARLHHKRIESQVRLSPGLVPLF
jgi:hypothetical protein